MNLGDKTKSITVRVNERELAYLRECADGYNMTPSKFLRLIIDMTMKTTESMDKTPTELINDEHKNTICNDIV